MKYEQFKNTYAIGVAAVVLMVVLRLSLGCHFLYEGVWKIGHPEFSAEGFLTQAKGPAAWIFYTMVPDIDGRQRLKIQEVPRSNQLLAAWGKLRTETERTYEQELKKREKSDAEGKKATQQALRRFRRASQQLLWSSEEKLEACVAKNEQTILAFLNPPEGPDAGEKERVPEPIRAWLADMAAIEKEYHDRLGDLAVESFGGKRPVLKPLVPQVYGNTSAADLVKGRSVRNPAGLQVVLLEEVIKGSSWIDAMSDLRRAAAATYGLSDDQKYDLDAIFHRYKLSVRDFLAESQRDIAAYFGSLERLEARHCGGNSGAAHQKKRMWDEQMKLRGEVNGWLSELKKMEGDYRRAVWNLLGDEQKQIGSLPTAWSMLDLVNFAVTYGLTAIGLCLVLGLFTRPAAIGGGLFLVFVLLTQPPWPTIYPPAPEVVGHALLVDKNFVEMVALFLVAATAVGRWCGLDYFVETCVIHWYNGFTK